MAAKKSAGSKGSDRKTEVLSVRIDPRTRYGLELLSRIQRRSVTGVVEWSIHESLSKELINCEHNVSVDDGLNRLWYVNEIERLIALAIYYPQLLNFEEFRKWKVIEYTSDFWLIEEPKSFRNFNWEEVLHNWELLAPLIEDATNKNVIRGLTRLELEEAGFKVIPF